MIRRFAVMLLAVLFVVSIVVITARAGPNKQNVFTSKVVVEMVSPKLAAIPSGYDVTVNYLETRDLFIANTYSAVTTESRRLSPTRAVTKPLPARTSRSGTF